MLQLAEQSYSYQGQDVDIMSFHEGLNGGINARGVEMTADSYKGHHYSHPSPWMKITGGGEGLEESMAENATISLVTVATTKTYRMSKWLGISTLENGCRMRFQ